MVAYKTGSFQRILKSLDPSCRAGLVYGPDAGLVAERAAQTVYHGAEYVALSLKD